MVVSLLVSKMFFKNLGEAMILNAINIVTVRMQNVDYTNNRNLFRAVKDLFIIDKHRMLYRGLFPIALGYTYLKFACQFMK